MKWLRPASDGRSRKWLNKSPDRGERCAFYEVQLGRNLPCFEMLTPSKLTISSINISIHNKSVKNRPWKAYKHSGGQQITCHYETTMCLTIHTKFPPPGNYLVLPSISHDSLLPHSFQFILISHYNKQQLHKKRTNKNTSKAFTELYSQTVTFS
jgi:hypothetical protein